MSQIIRVNYMWCRKAVTKVVRQSKKTSRSGNLGFRTEQAKQSLVRYIRDRRLKSGDKLPPQEQIRNDLGLGNATITRAMKALKKNGVLSTKRRVGAYVIDPQADGHPARIIGIGALQSGDPGLGPFYSCLFHHLSTNLHELGWQAIVFHCKPTYGQSAVGLEYFPGLRRSVEEHRLDAVLLMADISQDAWNWLETRKMHPLFVGGANHMPLGVMIDYSTLAQQAIEQLLEQGCTRPALAISSGVIGDFVRPVFTRMTHHLPNFVPERFYFAHSTEKAENIAEELLHLSPFEQPDGLAILDDQIALELIAGLVQQKLAGGDYLPPFVVQTNKQIPMAFPVLPLARFEVDIDVLARETVQMLESRLKLPATPLETKWIVPQKVTDKVEGETDHVVNLPKPSLNKNKSVTRVFSSERSLV